MLKYFLILTNGRFLNLSRIGFFRLLFTRIDTKHEGKGKSENKFHLLSQYQEKKDKKVEKYIDNKVNNNGKNPGNFGR